MSLILANIIGFIVAHWRVFAALAAFLVLLAVIIGFTRSCGRRAVKIDETRIQKINTENERERKKELETIITENSDVIKTVDNRSTIAETNTVERNRLIDEKVKEADKKIQETKRQGRDVTSAELECLLTGDCK